MSVSSSSSALPLWVSPVLVFFNPTMEVVTVRLRYRQGHEYQEVLSPCDGMHVRRLDLGLYFHPEDFFFFFGGGGGGWGGGGGGWEWSPNSC